MHVCGASGWVPIWLLFSHRGAHSAWHLATRLTLPVSPPIPLPRPQADPRYSAALSKGGELLASLQVRVCDGWFQRLSIDRLELAFDCDFALQRPMADLNHDCKRDCG